MWQLEHALVERVESEEGEGVIVEIEAILKKVRSFYEVKRVFIQYEIEDLMFTPMILHRSKTISQIELSEYKSRVSEGRLVEARSMITAVTNKQELVRELKLSVHSAIQVGEGSWSCVFLSCKDVSFTIRYISCLFVCHVTLIQLPLTSTN